MSDHRDVSQFVLYGSIVRNLKALRKLVADLTTDDDAIGTLAAMESISGELNQWVRNLREIIDGDGGKLRPTFPIIAGDQGRVEHPQAELAWGTTPEEAVEAMLKSEGPIRLEDLQKNGFAGRLTESGWSWLNPIGAAR